MQTGNKTSKQWWKCHAWLLIVLSWFSCASEIQSSNDLSLQRYNVDAKLKEYRAVYQMRRGGDFWAIAVVKLSSIKYQGQDAYRHAIALHFETETVFDETLFAADDFTLLAKFISAGFGEDLSWRLFTQHEGKITGSQVFAKGTKPQTFEKSLTAIPSGNAMYFMAISNLAPEQTHTFSGAEHDIEFTETLRVLARTEPETENEVFPEAWQLELKNSLVPNHKTDIWLSTEPSLPVKKIVSGGCN